MWDYIPIHRLQPMVWLDGQGLGRNNWKIGGKVNRTLWMSKKYVKIFVFLWMFTKGWPQQRRILIIKWIGWPILGMPVSFFPSHPCHHPMDWWTKWHGGRNGRCSDGVNNIDSPLLRLAWLWPLLSVSLPAAKINTVPDMALFSSVISQLPGGRLVTLNSSIMEGEAFCSCRNRHSGYGFAFSASILLLKLPSMDGLTECLIQHHHIPHSIA